MFRYKNNSYCFTYYTQGNIIFHFIYTIFDKELFSKYTNSHAKECKLYNKLLNKISPEIELSISGPFRKDGPALVPILYIYISPTQENLSTCSPLLSFLQVFIFLTYSRA